MAQPRKRIVKLETKQSLVADLKEQIAQAPALVVVAYQGLKVEEMVSLREEVRKAGGRFAVVKNTLLRRATAGTDLEPLQEHFFGSTALCLSGQEDPIAPARLLVKFAKDHEALSVKVGALDGKPLSAKEVMALSQLPSKEGLLAKALGSMQAPAQNLVGVLAALARNLAYAIDQIRKQKETAGA